MKVRRDSLRDARSSTRTFSKTLLELRELSNSPKRIPTPLLSSEERLRNAGNSLKLPSKKRKKPERSSKDSRMKSPNFTRLSSKDLVFLLAKTTLFTNS